MNKIELIEIVNCAEILGKSVCLKSFSDDIDDPLVKMAEGANDMLAMAMTKKLMDMTGLTRDDLAEHLADYDNVKQYIDLNEKIREAKKKASAE
jgi:hypothetical protein